MLTRGIVSAIALIFAATAHAATPEQTCQSKRAKAAAKYVKCIQKPVATYYGGTPYDSFKLGKCARKYGETWAKLQQKALQSPSVETCDAARFVDNLDGTVTDNLTALRWEKKTDDASIHDKDNQYGWSDLNALYRPDGSAFTTFLATLNTPACFAGFCDWRLPTLAELLSIAQPAFPDCDTPPCIDPILGPAETGYLSASEDLTVANEVWGVTFSSAAGFPVQGKSFGAFARAVRGGF